MAAVVAHLDSKTNIVYLTGSTVNNKSMAINPIALTSFIVLDDFEFRTEDLDGRQQLYLQHMNRQICLECRIVQKISNDKVLIFLNKEYARWPTIDQFFVIYDENELIVGSGKCCELGPNLLEVRNFLEIMGNNSQVSFDESAEANFSSAELIDRIYLPHRSLEYKKYWLDILLENREDLLYDHQFGDTPVNRIQAGMDSYYEPR